MLATLNLQLTPIAPSDDTLQTSLLAPDSGADDSIVFADMMQLRFHAMPGSGDGGGEILPQGGSELPLQAGLTEGLLSKPEISHDLMSLEESLAGAEVPQIALQLPLQYPATSGEAAHTTLLAAAAITVAVPDARALPMVGLQTPSIPNRSIPVNDIRAASAASGDALRAMSGLRDGSLSGVAPVDLPRRTEISPLAGMAASSEKISEVFKARSTVTQPVQVLNAQPNPQQQLLVTSPSAALSAAEASYAAAAQQVTDLIPTSVRDSAWGEQVGQRVLMMAGNRMHTAEIRLTPAELGPLRVQVSVDDGAANVTFHAQHAVTREAIEQALPRLREMLAENGLSLGQANVGEQGVAERNQDESPDEQVSHPGADDTLEAGADDGSSQRRTVVSSNSLVDTFV